MNYDYNNQYQTSYGAQGGMGGGGFVNQPSSQGGSQTTPSKTYGKDTLRPVTIRQLLNAQHPHPDADFKVDGSEVTQVSDECVNQCSKIHLSTFLDAYRYQVTFIGQVRNISTQTTHITYKLDDGTATMEVKKFNENDSMNAGDAPKPPEKAPVEGDYARVWGRLKEFNDKRTVGAHIIRKIVDFNEVQYHLLEATAVHLFFTKGPPEQLQGQKNNAQVAPAQISYGQPAGGMGGMGAPTGQYTQPLPPLSMHARRVLEKLRAVEQNNEGLHYQHLSAELNLSAQDVLKAGDELQSASLIFSTVDDFTWAALET
ncbi:MAG: hypothetical protein M1823_003381 [Watsoniomyces obsoletus]|nr:MAG: hypothetical protein M1823_003381 [Watsoniomyces obsoletus]